ncbi:hypothetical protein ACIPC1_06345 [Streptomyces sp. NPDC087263]|uniref:hypothetical protein n=1 Tax=Streptomyces sp. NPDC087263 TaxID=3365773 RepID=UPI0037FBAED8
MTPGPGRITWPPPELAVPPVQLPPTAPVTGADDVRRYDGLSYATNSGYRARLLDLLVPRRPNVPPWWCGFTAAPGWRGTGVTHRRP